jgi:hypothetical protein
MRREAKLVLLDSLPEPRLRSRFGNWSLRRQTAELVHRPTQYAVDLERKSRSVSQPFLPSWAIQSRTSAALADPESRKVYLARLVTGETVKFRFAALDGDYVSLWGLDSRGTCAPEIRGGPPEKLLNINVRADAIMYVAELPPARENGMEKFMEQMRRRRAAEVSQAAPEGGRNDAA